MPAAPPLIRLHQVVERFPSGLQAARGAAGTRRWQRRMVFPLAVVLQVTTLQFVNKGVGQDLEARLTGK